VGVDDRSDDGQSESGSLPSSRLVEPKHGLSPVRVDTGTVAFDQEPVGGRSDANRDRGAGVLGAPSGPSSAARRSVLHGVSEQVFEGPLEASSIDLERPNPGDGEERHRRGAQRDERESFASSVVLARRSPCPSDQTAEQPTTAASHCAPGVSRAVQTYTVTPIGSSVETRSSAERGGNCHVATI
jgi:hypothetical protein